MTTATSDTPTLAKQLIDAGVHYGHKSSNWHPRMRPYIYAKRGGLHIIDVRETVKGLLRAKKFVTRLVAEGKDVLFAGTKRQASVIGPVCEEVGMPYVTERWLGGTLTNFQTIHSRLKRLEELEALMESEDWQHYSKKMASQLRREKRKIDRNLGGLRGLDHLPGALFAVDVHREYKAVKEAKRLGIPTICLIDTDSDPDLVDLPIPGNDDSTRAVELIVRELGQAVAEGKTGEAQESLRREAIGAAQSQAGESPTEAATAESGSTATSEGAGEPGAATGEPSEPQSYHAG